MDSGKQMKKYFLIALIVSLSISALIGIFIFLFSDGGELEFRILLTTLTFGAFSMTALFNSILYERGRFKPFALVGIIISIVSFFYTIGLIWEIIKVTDNEFIYRTFFTLVAITISTSQASLLLLISNSRSIVRGSLWATIAFIAIITLMILAAVWELVEFDTLYFRLFGVFIILDVLGTIVTPILHKVVKMDQSQVGKGTDGSPYRKL